MQEALLDKIVLLIAWSLLFGIGIASLRAINIGWQPFMGLHLLLLTGVWGLVFLRRHLAYRTRCLVLLGLIFLSGLAGYTGLGPAADAKVGFVFVTFIAALFLPLGWMLLIWGLQCISLILLGIAWVAGTLTFKFDFPTYAADPLVWATAIWTILMYSVVVAYVAFTTIDLLKRKTIQVVKQAEHTQTILDSIQDSIMTIDAHGTIQYCNPATLHCFGYTREQLTGQNVSILMPGRHLGREIDGLRSDGSLFPIELTITEISHSGQRAYLGIVRDISEQKRIEQAKNQFVATVSHELRTPLTALSGALNLIKHTTKDTLGAQETQLMDIATRNCQRLNHLINDILDFEKLSAGKMEFAIGNHPLLPLIRQAIDDHRTYCAERQITIVVKAAAPEYSITADKHRLMQVLANLLSNAIKFSPQNGQVDLLIEQASASVRVTVTDQGPGIPATYRDQVFVKFSQADGADSRPKGGTGLGLAISKELIQGMAGRIGFDSREGDGASFWFELPIGKATQTPSQYNPDPSC